MRTEICEQLGIEFPIFAFSHCRDVVAAVTKAGGLGVLGAVGFSPEELEIELTWLDENVGDRPYGVDIVIPSKYEGMDIDDMTPEELEAEMAKHIPHGHRDFGTKILADHGVPDLPEDEKHHELLGLDGGHRRTPGRGHPAPRQGQARRQRARHPAARRDRPASRGRAGSSAPCAARSGTRCGTRRPASTSSSARAPRAAATAARSPRSCCGPR